MAWTQPSTVVSEDKNDIVSAVASVVAAEARSANPGDPPSHMQLLLIALEIDRRQDELWGAQR